MDKLLATISLTEIIQALFGLLGAAIAAFFGYYAAIRKSREDIRVQSTQFTQKAEQDFREDLSKQLEDAYRRLDAQLSRTDEREKKNTDLLKQIDILWEERVTLKTRISTLEAELIAARRRIEQLKEELEKFEKKVFYIAKPEQMKENT